MLTLVFFYLVKEVQISLLTHSVCCSNNGNSAVPSILLVCIQCILSIFLLFVVYELSTNVSVFQFMCTKT